MTTKVAARAAREIAVGAAGGRKPVCISKAQRNVHVAFEALAVLLVAPFNFWLATRPELPKAARGFAATCGVATLLVDGGLLISYVKQKNEEKKEKQNGS